MHANPKGLQSHILHLQQHLRMSFLLGFGGRALMMMQIWGPWFRTTPTTHLQMSVMRLDGIGLGSLKFATAYSRFFYYTTFVYMMFCLYIYIYLYIYAHFLIHTHTRTHTNIYMRQCNNLVVAKPCLFPVWLCRICWILAWQCWLLSLRPLRRLVGLCARTYACMHACTHHICNCITCWYVT